MKKLLLLLSICFCFSSCTLLELLEYKKVSGNVYKKFDKYQNCTFYESRAKGSENFLIYAVENEYGKYARIVFKYEGKDWIFFDRAFVVNKAGERLEFVVDTLSKTTDTFVDGKKVKVKEVYDFPITDEEKLQNLHDLLQGEKVELCLQGKGKKVYKIKKTQALLEILEFYSTL